MSELRELYQEVILDHNRRPRNFGKLEAPTATAEGYNPLCGDQLTVYLRIEDGTVRDVRFEGSGCAISKASASIMTDSIKGKTTCEVSTIFGMVHSMLTETATIDPDELGKLAVLSGVREFPARVKCASLAWHTLNAALRGHTETVITE